MTRTTIVRCPRCHHRAPVQKRSALWWLALLGAAVFFVAMVLASSLIGPFITLAVPFMGLVGFAFGPLHSLVAEEPSCAACGRVLTVPATERDARRVVVLSAAPAAR